MTTLQDLIDAVRLRTSRESDTSINDPEIAGYLNASLAELDDLLISTYEDYKLTEYDVTVTTSTEGASFALPADFYKARGLSRLYGGYYVRVDPYTFNERSRYAFPWLTAHPYLAVHYRIEGTVCKIVPWTSAAGSYRLWYVPKFTTLSVSDSLASYMDVNAWCEYAIVDTCIKVQAKQQEDVSIFAGQKQELRLRILDIAKQRDAGGLKRRVNVSRCNCSSFPCMCWGA